MGFGIFKRIGSGGRFARFLLPGAIGLLAVGSIASVLVWRHDPSRTLPFYQPSGSNSADHWRAFGGAWDISGNSMRNESTERGAKLLTGSPKWTDYSMAADLEMLGPGDAGVIVRVSDAEVASIRTPATISVSALSITRSLLDAHITVGRNIRPPLSQAASDRLSGITCELPWWAAKSKLRPLRVRREN